MAPLTSPPHPRFGCRAACVASTVPRVLARSTQCYGGALRFAPRPGGRHRARVSAAAAGGLHGSEAWLRCPGALRRAADALGPARGSAAAWWPSIASELPLPPWRLLPARSARRAADAPHRPELRALVRSTGPRLGCRALGGLHRAADALHGPELRLPRPGASTAPLVLVRSTAPEARLLPWCLHRA